MSTGRTIRMNRTTRTRLVEGYAGPLAPSKSLRCAAPRSRTQPVVAHCPRRVTGDDDVVADFERGPGDALPGKLAAAAPLDRPPLHLAGWRRHFDVHPGMRVAEQELHKLALDRHFPADVVDRVEGV